MQLRWRTCSGSALVPGLEEQAIGVAPGHRPSPSDGRVFTLLAREDVVLVQELERRPGRITG